MQRIIWAMPCALYTAKHVWRLYGFTNVVEKYYIFIRRAGYYQFYVLIRNTKLNKFIDKNL